MLRRRTREVREAWLRAGKQPLEWLPIAHVIVAEVEQEKATIADGETWSEQPLKWFLIAYVIVAEVE